MFIQILEVCVLIVAVYIIYKIILLVLKHITKRTVISVQAVSGIKFILRLLALIVVVLGIFTVLGASAERIFSFATLTGILLGFASTEVLGQMISGLYIIIAAPFDVGELIGFGTYEGIVAKIGMGYTHIRLLDNTIIRIPNNKLLDTVVKNYTVKLTEDLKKRLEMMRAEVEAEISELPESGKIDRAEATTGKRDGILDDISDLTDKLEAIGKMLIDEEITRYVFKIEVDLSLDPAVVIRRLDGVCNKFRKFFGFKPVAFLKNLGYRAQFYIRIYTSDPANILHHLDNFKTEIAYALYGKNGGVNK